MKFKEWVKFCKTRRGLRTEEVCARLGISVRTLSGLNCGRQTPSAALQLAVYRESGGRVRSILDFLSPAQEAAFKLGKPVVMPRGAFSRRSPATTKGPSGQRPANDGVEWSTLTPEEKAALRLGRTVGV